MKFPDKMTFGEMYHPAMKITDQVKADEWFEACVEYAMRDGTSREEAEKNERSNLGYFSGYYDNKTAARVYKLFNCEHPIFGKAQPTPEEAFKAGVELAKQQEEN